MLNNAVFLHTLRSNEDFRNLVIKEHPDLKNHINSYKDNPRCKCRRDILQYVSNHQDVFNKSADEWVDIAPNININTRKVPTVEEKKVEVTNKEMEEAGRNIQKRSTPRNNIAGEVYEIPAEPQAYKELISHLTKEHAVYRSVNVMADEKDGKKIWLVFFV